MILMVFLMANCKHRAIKFKAKGMDVPNKQASVKFDFIKRVELKALYVNLYAFNDTVLVSSFDERRFVKIYEYDGDLNLRKKHNFRIGQGPGDLNGASNFALCDNRWFVFDKFQLRISEFDRDYKYLRMRKAKRNYAFPIIAENCKRLICSDSNWIGNNGIQYFVYRVDFPEQKMKKLFYLHKYDQTINGKFIIGNKSFFYVYYKRKLYLLNKADYTISIIDMNGKLEKSVRVKFKRISTPRDKIKDWVHEYIRHPKMPMTFPPYIYPVAGIIPLNKGFIVVRINGYNKNCEDINGFAEGDYFNYNLEPMGKVNIPCFSNIFVCSNVYWGRYMSSYAENNFYLIKEDEEDNKTYLEKWRVEE